MHFPKMHVWHPAGRSRSLDLLSCEHHPPKSDEPKAKMHAFVSAPVLRSAFLRGGGVCRSGHAAGCALFRGRAPASLRMLSSPPDTVMATVEQKLEAALAPARLMVTPTYGDPNGAHVSIEVVSEAFEGMMTVKRHQKVYKVIWEELQVRLVFLLTVARRRQRSSSPTGLMHFFVQLFSWRDANLFSAIYVCLMNRVPFTPSTSW